MKRKLTLPALMAVVAFGLIGAVQVVIIPLAVLAIAALVVLLTDGRYLLGLLAMFGCLLLSFTMGGAALAIETAFLVLLPATIMTICIRLNRPAIFTIVAVMIPFLFLAGVYFAAVGETSAYFERISPELKAEFERISESLGIKARLIATPGEYEKLTESYLDTMKMLIRFLPAVLLASLTMVVILAYYLIGYGFKREGRFILTLPQFRSWKIDERILVFLGLGLLLALLAEDVIYDVGENLALYAWLLFSLGGLSLVEFSLQKSQVGRIGKTLIYLGLVIFNIYSGILLGVIGLIDSHFDFRRVRAAKFG